MEERSTTENSTEDVTVLTEMVASLEEKNKCLESEIQILNERVKFLLNRSFGRSSEKFVNPDQLQLNLEFPDVEPPEDNANDSDDDDNCEHINYIRRKKKPGKKPLPTHLPRETVVHDIPCSDKICACGDKMDCIGEEKSEQLDVVPAQLKVIEHVRPKYACKSCEEGVKIAPVPKHPIPKSIGTPGFLANMLVSKYLDHLPLYRQSQMWQRLDVDISRGTLSNMALRCGQLFSPLVELLKNIIVSSDYAKADETTITVLDHNGERGSFKDYMWIFTSGDSENRTVVFEYHSSRRGQVAEDFFEGFQGFLQTDGYAGYNGVREQKGVTSLGCMQHCRRRFVDVVKLTPKNKTGAAHEAVAMIAKLYRIEASAKDKKLTSDEVHELRQQKSKPILDKFKTWLDKKLPHVLPKSKLGDAIKYALNQWDSLNVYLQDGRLDIDNGSTEREAKPFACGRKNWLYAGSIDGAESSANIFSLARTCIANDLNPYYYFRYILYKLPYAMTQSDLDALLPQNLDKDLIRYFEPYLEPG